MDRKEFLKICAGGCLGFAGVSLLADCKPTKHIQAVVADNKIQLEKKEFVIQKNEKTSYRKNLITKPESSNYPIVVYRFSETEYTALLLRCTHQNNELSMNGDILSCPAHGSEFSNKGEVIQGPADQKLQTFKVTGDDKYIYIHLV